MDFELMKFPRGYFNEWHSSYNCSPQESLGQQHLEYYQQKRNSKGWLVMSVSKRRSSQLAKVEINNYKSSPGG